MIFLIKLIVVEVEFQQASDKINLGQVKNYQIVVIIRDMVDLLGGLKVEQYSRIYRFHGMTMKKIRKVFAPEF